METRSKRRKLEEEFKKQMYEADTEEEDATDEQATSGSADLACRKEDAVSADLECQKA